MKVNGTNIYMTRGDTAFFTLDIEIEENFDIEKVFFTVKRNTKTSQIIFQKTWLNDETSNGVPNGITVSTEEGLTENSNVYEIEIKAEDTNEVEFGKYRYDVQINYTDSNDPNYEGILTIIKPSIFGIEEEVTQEGWPE